MDPPPYVFEQIRWDASGIEHPLYDLVRKNVGELPIFGAGYVVHNAQFFVGDHLSGAPMHYHAHAVNALVAGKKRWLLFPPKDAAYSKLPAATWLDDARLDDLTDQGIDVIQCVQPQGAVMYVPSGWGHVVLNLEPSVGTAFEFHQKGELTWSFEERASDLVTTSRRL